MPVTIREVAIAAGVSTAAVSKVLHGRGKSVRVSEARAKIIREVAEQLQYRPNALARSLRSSRTHTVGLFFEGFANLSGGPLYYLHLLDGAGSAFFTEGYRLAILPELSLEDISHSLGDGLLEGVIWCKLLRDEETMALVDKCPVPIVSLNAAPPEKPGNAVFVTCDNEGGIELALDHLWELGHREILFVREREEVKTPDCAARTEAFRKGVEKRSGFVREEDVATWDWNLFEFNHWWQRGATHTALLCWTERGAANILRHAQQLGISVPGELSVVGFDSTQFCETTRPTLTAVRQPIFEMARHAGEVLLNMIRGNRPVNISYVFPCGFDVRESTAPPARVPTYR